MKNLITVVAPFPTRAITTKPDLPCTDPRFVYVPASQTDITQTWRKHGWKPLAKRKSK